MNCSVFVKSFAKSYRGGFGRPAKPIRPMVSLLKHPRNLSNETVAGNGGKYLLSVFSGLISMLPKNHLKQLNLFISATASQLKAWILLKKVFG
ncbi:hypothetical protein ACFSJU_07410 [Paradesertivirga mongoliensis]|uniref:Transposase n=1 Tax=Paradesertivirga mongoliensis TaxID=2100740 RepID=A0ABW4ZJX9_9SPHI|nr:hypothetical protein [Pedobacter mongoliensis]